MNVIDEGQIKGEDQEQKEHAMHSNLNNDNSGSSDNNNKNANTNTDKYTMNNHFVQREEQQQLVEEDQDADGKKKRISNKEVEKTISKKKRNSNHHGNTNDSNSSGGGHKRCSSLDNDKNNNYKLQLQLQQQQQYHLPATSNVTVSGGHSNNSHNNNSSSSDHQLKRKRNGSISHIHNSKSTPQFSSNTLSTQPTNLTNALSQQKSNLMNETTINNNNSPIIDENNNNSGTQRQRSKSDYHGTKPKQIGHSPNVERKLILRQTLKLRGIEEVKVRGISLKYESVYHEFLEEVITKKEFISEINNFNHFLASNQPSAGCMMLGCLCCCFTLGLSVLPFTLQLHHFERKARNYIKELNVKFKANNLKWELIAASEEDKESHLLVTFEKEIENSNKM
ncbi:hypothetical protein ABK040_012035 [Willaertia magna]